MKKTLIAVALLSSSVAAFADDGKIDFVGSITDDACTIVNNMTNPLIVTLGTVSRTAFTGAGSTAAPTKFTIALTNCPSSVNSAVVKFDGLADSTVNSILALTPDSGVATGVGIQLTDNNNVVVPLYTASSAYTLQSGANNLDFVARYYATEDLVESGSANSTSNFTIVYN